MSDEENRRTTQTDEFWEQLRIQPIALALPGGVGYTLRAYRSSTDVAAPETDPELAEDAFDAASASVVRHRHSDDLEHLGEDFDESELAAQAGPFTGNKPTEAGDDEGGDDEEADETGDDDEAEPSEQEVPVFIGRKGRLYLFRSPEKLVEFVKSNPDNDLSQLDTWPDLVKQLKPAHIAPLSEDVYELDLVVQNLRGGPDAWDPTLILKAGEIARDLGYALSQPTLLVSLAPGSPLDDLDEAVRGSEAGGVGAIFARRRLRKVPVQQCALGWRTLIGRISSVSDWRD